MACVSAGCLFSSGGCTRIKGGAGGRRQKAEALQIAAQEELRAELSQFVDFFESSVESAAMEVERNLGTGDNRRLVALWRVRMIQQCRSATKEPDPRLAMLDLWTLCQRMVDYFEKGEGRAASAGARKIAEEASIQAYAAIDELVRRYVPEEAYPAAREGMLEFARANPLTGEFEDVPAKSFSDEAAEQGYLERIARVPLSPFTALTGIGNTPEAIRMVSASADRFTHVVEDLPASMRWQVQLLALNMEDMPIVADTVDSLKKASDSSERLTQILQTLPQDLREQGGALMDQVDEMQPGVRQTLTEAQATAERIEAASREAKALTVEANTTVASVQEASVALEKVADAVTVTAREIRKLMPETETDEGRQTGGATPPRAAPIENQPDTSFSFQAVTTSAEALGETTVKLQALLTELREVIDSDAIPKQVKAIDVQVGETLENTTVRMRGLIDHLAKRGAQLIVLLFALLLVYQLLRLRLRPQGPASA